jgi:hypothetical protein
LPLTINTISIFYVLPLGDGFFEREIFNYVGSWCIQSNAQNQMGGQAIPELILDECHSWETTLIFHKTRTWKYDILVCFMNFKSLCLRIFTHNITWISLDVAWYFFINGSLQHILPCHPSSTWHGPHRVYGLQLG